MDKQIKYGSLVFSLWLLVLIGLPMVPTQTLNQTSPVAWYSWFIGRPTLPPPMPEDLKTEAYTRERLADLVKHRKKVLVITTAQWCRYCLVNKPLWNDVLIKTQLAELGVTVLIADVSGSEPEANSFLRDRNRMTIPYYVAYVPGRNPTELPTSFTLSDLVSILKNTYK